MLIQKDAKHENADLDALVGLRALLIQKDAKLISGRNIFTLRLRALLIQKDAKQHLVLMRFSGV